MAHVREKLGSRHGCLLSTLLCGFKFVFAVMLLGNIHDKAGDFGDSAVFDQWLAKRSHNDVGAGQRSHPCYELCRGLSFNDAGKVFCCGEPLFCVRDEIRECSVVVCFVEAVVVLSVLFSFLRFADTQ